MGESPHQDPSGSGARLDVGKLYSSEVYKSVQVATGSGGPRRAAREGQDDGLVRQSRRRRLQGLDAIRTLGRSLTQNCRHVFRDTVCPGHGQTCLRSAAGKHGRRPSLADLQTTRSRPSVEDLSLQRPLSWSHRKGCGAAVLRNGPKHAPLQAGASARFRSRREKMPQYAAADVV